MTMNNPEPTLFPLRLNLSIDGDLTRLSLGPAIGVVIPLFSLNLPFSYLVVMFLDFVGAMSLERSFISDCRAPSLFESAWQGSGQLKSGGPAQKPVWNGNRQTGKGGTPADSSVQIRDSSAQIQDSSVQTQDDPWFPPGIGISLMLETPFSTCRSESSAAFVYQLADFPNIPVWIVPLVSLIIYYVAKKGLPRL